MPAQLDPRHASALRYAVEGYTAYEISRAVDGLVLGELTAAGYLGPLAGPRAQVKLTDAGRQALRAEVAL